jgi:hypothetical protein
MQHFFAVAAIVIDGLFLLIDAENPLSGSTPLGLPAISNGFVGHVFSCFDCTRHCEHSEAIQKRTGVLRCARNDELL